MRELTVKIQLRTEYMSTEADAADALEDIAGYLRDFTHNGRAVSGVQTVYDNNGQSVGNWEIL
jgi:hypothetical protein